MATSRRINDKTKLQRIDLRTTVKVKDTLTRAAQLADVSLSTFLLDAACEKAKAVLNEHEVLQLSLVERDRFLSLLDAPAKPTTQLKAAMRKYLDKGK